MGHMFSPALGFFPGAKRLGGGSGQMQHIMAVLHRFAQFGQGSRTEKKNQGQVCLSAIVLLWVHSYLGSARRWRATSHPSLKAPAAEGQFRKCLSCSFTGENHSKYINHRTPDVFALNVQTNHE